MGIVNVTPDSFSDGGRHYGVEAGLAHARRLIAEGADILDIGGESTRPRAEPVSEAEELDRVIPLIRALRAESDIPLSIDTMKPGVAKAAVEAGCETWNDIIALRNPGALETAAALGCSVVLMHMRGEPRTMQADPRYDDVLGEVSDFLCERAEAAMAAGVPREKIAFDPGIGFGKRLEHNLTLLAHLDRIVALGFPVLLGVSRKSFIRAIDSTAIDAHQRRGGGMAAALHGADKGVAMLRVHDVAEMVQALAVRTAIRQASGHE